jgi:hypothetical protein
MPSRSAMMRWKQLRLKDPTLHGDFPPEALHQCAK